MEKKLAALGGAGEKKSGCGCGSKPPSATKAKVEEKQEEAAKKSAEATAKASADVKAALAGAEAKKA